MQQQPLISVVIPAYNEEPRIQRALDSMSNQTYANLEIIVVDDHSTDNTKQVVLAAAEKDPRIQYCLLPEKPARRKDWRGYDINAGFAARNYGFKRARGIWITTQDADDASLLNRIEAQHALAVRYKATLVTIQWQKLKPELLGKKLDVERIFKERDPATFVIPPEAIISRALSNRGILMREWLPHRFIPFPIKYFPLTRPLFFPKTEPYLGADNSMMFHRKVLDAGIWFRPRNERIWAVPSGRGSGRDFAFRVAVEFKDCWSFKLPLYLWDVRTEHAGYEDYAQFLVS